MPINKGLEGILRTKTTIRERVVLRIVGENEGNHGGKSRSGSAAEEGHRGSVGNAKIA